MVWCEKRGNNPTSSLIATTTASTPTSTVADTFLLPAWSEPGSHPKWPKLSPVTPTSALRYRPTRTLSCTTRRRRSGRCQGRGRRVHEQSRMHDCGQLGLVPFSSDRDDRKQRFRSG